jgi:hypothetical protein
VTLRRVGRNVSPIGKTYQVSIGTIARKTPLQPAHKPGGSDDSNGFEDVQRSSRAIARKKRDVARRLHRVINYF